ncbi:MAG: hypothetical protein ACPGJV_13540 [Bacteriovoracaceae bacterium]
MLPVSSKNDYLKLIFDSNLNLPTEPDKDFKHDGWKSWNDWLGRPYPKFNVIRKEIIRLSIKYKLLTKEDIKTFLKKYKNLHNIPKDFERYYSKKGFDSWDLILKPVNYVHSYDIEVFPEKEICYRKAKRLAKKFRVRSRVEWHNLCKNLKINFPKQPSKTGYKGWKTWEKFLSYSWEKNLKVEKYATFEEAASHLKKINLPTEQAWLEYFDLNNPIYTSKGKVIPKRLPHVYKDKYKSFSQFTDYKPPTTLNFYIRKGEYLTKEEAIIYFKYLNVYAQKCWDRYKKVNMHQKHKFNFLPDNPEIEYKDFSWKKSVNRSKIFKSERVNEINVYIDFKRVKTKDFYRPYYLAHQYIKKLGFTNTDEWRKYIKGEFKNLPPLPGDITKCPDEYYEGKGFVCWHGFFGIKGRKVRDHNMHIKFIYHREIAQSLNCRSKEEYYQKIDELNLNIPKGPHRVYKVYGWNSWEDWLGQKELFHSVRRICYLDAKLLIQTIALKHKLLTPSEVRSHMFYLPKKFKVHYQVEQTYTPFGFEGWDEILRIPRLVYSKLDSLNEENENQPDNSVSDCLAS